MIPEWAEKYRKPGTTIKKIGNGYYLYSATSKIVEGKKYPVSVQNVIQQITFSRSLPFSVKLKETPVRLI